MRLPAPARSIAIGRICTVSENATRILRIFAGRVRHRSQRCSMMICLIIFISMCHHRSGSSRTSTHHCRSRFPANRIIGNRMHVHNDEIRVDILSIKLDRGSSRMLLLGSKKSKHATFTAIMSPLYVHLQSSEVALLFQEASRVENGH